ncbi:DNA cytosine methyltransferase [Filifactor alocis]|uniref:DNA cytosine methyltransferase n=1 Tax=Filifactor alocis TaxID=143361 RepID=UPI003FA03D32
MKLMYNVIDLTSDTDTTKENIGLSHGFYNSNRCNIKTSNELTLENIQNIDADMILNNTDIIIGGPPCYKYTPFGETHTDPENIFISYKRILETMKPKIFIFANPVFTIDMFHGRLLKTITTELEQLGYTITHLVTNDKDYKTGTNTQRFFLVGTLGEHSFDFPTSNEKIKFHNGSKISPIPEKLSEQIAHKVIKTLDAHSELFM